jgi:hypothetical protein
MIETPDTAKKYMAAISRIRELPALFFGSAAIARFGWSSKTGSHYLWLWQKKGLVLPLGGHSDVFANLLVDPKPNTGVMCRMAMPQAVIIGVDALRRAGWTTQVQGMPTIAVPDWQPSYKTNFYKNSPRDKAWFAQAQKSIQASTEHGLPVLTPEFALADLIRLGWDKCPLDPDDIDWPDEPFAGQKWLKACAALHVDQADCNPGGSCMLSSS